jgi:hypothetical protein
MYFLREGQKNLRKFETLEKAVKRYEHLIKYNCRDDVELYKVIDNDLCECIRFHYGNYLAIMEDTVMTMNNYIAEFK